MDAATIIERLGLQPHPEGGFFRETWRHRAPQDARGAGTAIYFLLRARDRSAWHRIDADELWHHHGGAPLLLRRSPDDKTPSEDARLGLDLDAGEQPQLCVPSGWWQSAVSLGEWTLVSCTVSPAFTFDGFELAPEGFEPGRTELF